MKGRNYRSAAGQAYTRQKYIRGTPQVKVSKFNMGDLSTHFTRAVHLNSQERVQIRHNALESARVSANKILFDKYGETGYRVQLCVFPHIILRENKMIATAGADRLQEGMRRAFGKPTGRAARVNVGQSIMIISVNEDGVDTARKALATAGTKLPMKTRVSVEEAPPALVQDVAESKVSEETAVIEEEPVVPQPAEAVAPVGS